MNGRNHYALQFESKCVTNTSEKCSNLCGLSIDEKYQCQDGKALVADSSFIVLCPPDEEIISRSPSVSERPPSLSSSTTIGGYYNNTHCD